MALKVWLPLSGDYRVNYGVTYAFVYLNANSSSAPRASYENSILGDKAITLNTTYDVEISTQVSNAFSFSFWVKEGENNDVGAPLFTLRNSDSENVCVCSKTADGYAIPAIASGTLFSLTPGWNHVAIIADGTKVKAYVNGVQSTAGDVTQITTVSATTITLGGLLTINSFTYWKGAICHFKYYDQAISLFEVVKESEGLVLNYSFNGVVSLGTGITLPAGTTATTFGFGDKEYDLSGNGFDGTFGEVKPTGSLDTPMYSSSMDFTESSGITSANIITTEFASRFTITVWAKGTGAFLSIGNWAALSASDSSAWHFLAISSGKMYVDGVETGSASGSMPTGSNAVTITGGFAGKLSDLRIYAKTMTADEIKTLYTRKAAVDNTGKVIASEFVVNDEVTAPGFSKAGVVSSSELSNWNSADLDGVSIDTWTDKTITPTDVTKFAIYQTSGAVNATDIIEY